VKPQLFTSAFGVPQSTLDSLGIFNLAVNVDTLLFPDPMLLEHSSHREMRAAHATFESHFDTVRKLIAGSKLENDKPAKSAKDRLRFPEIQGTCLGYGANGISGSGAGKVMSDRLFITGGQIIDLGIDDPDLFLAMGLFEKDFGPDLIGDMLTNIVFEHIADFNQRVLKTLGIPTKKFTVKTPFSTHIRDFITNPASINSPLILLPTDILRALPIALDWRGVQEVASENDQFRQSLNGSVAKLWSRKTLESKAQLRAWALSSSNAFGDLLDMVHGHDGKPYDFIGDPLGEMLWKRIGDQIVSAHPLKIPTPHKKDGPNLVAVVENIIDRFTFLIEQRDLWKELYHSGSPRLESAVQRIFYAIAQSYCEANNVDITPEADTGRGPVDFKFSLGFNERVIVEIKLSSNSKVVSGYTGQLEIYNRAECPIKSYYLVIDVGQMRMKRKKLDLIKTNAVVNNLPISELRYVDGLPKKSASKA